MSQQLELERTFLAKYIPHNLETTSGVELIDMYIPASASHPNLRIRKKGEAYEITKKIRITDDASEQEEHTIALTQEEFQSFASVSAKQVHKMRFQYRSAEIDVFLGLLAGLVLVDFEFSNTEEKDAFIPPEFCLADVTQEEFLAGGLLAGKTYKDIEANLQKLEYSKLEVNIT